MSSKPPSTLAQSFDCDSNLRLSAYYVGQSPTPPELVRASRSELRRLVRRLLERNEAPPLEPTTVINEVARRLLGSGGQQDLPSRGDFFADLAGALRRTLARRGKEKASESSDPPIVLDSLGATPIPSFLEALAELETWRPQHAQVAVLRLIGGLTSAEIAEHLELTEQQAASLWAKASAWLSRRLSGDWSNGRSMPR